METTDSNRLLLLALSFLRRNVPKEKIKRQTETEGGRGRGREGRRPIYKQLRRQMAAAAAAETKSKEEKANPETGPTRDSRHARLAWNYLRRPLRRGRHSRGIDKVLRNSDLNFQVRRTFGRQRAKLDIDTSFRGASRVV